MESTSPLPHGPTGDELRAAIGRLASRLFELIDDHWPPWWAWLAFALALVVFGFLARGRSLRALAVAPPDDAERARARAAGQALAARGPIGLVLGGGGAKGAYQIGCWKALRECGMDRYGPLAGTSVGALNAVLVAQDEFDRSERIWHDMDFGRVLRMRWWLLPLAVTIRVVLFVPYLGKFAFPARFIPAPLFRAVNGWQEGWRSGEPQRSMAAVLELYTTFVRSPTSADNVMNLVLGGVVLAGLSAWWLLATPLIALVVLLMVAPFLALLVVTYTSWLASLLDQLATRLVLANNGPLAGLLLECVDPAQLKACPRPVFVTLSSLREVVRQRQFQLPKRLAGKAIEFEPVRSDAARPADADFGSALAGALPPSTESTVEYVPRHFDVRSEAPDRMRELILQSAGLPEIFPARCFDGVTYVDGGLADNEPLTALAALPGQAVIVVMPLTIGVTRRASAPDCG
jgi:hypothetical protein